MHLTLLTKTTPWCVAATEFLLSLRPDSLVYRGERDAPPPWDRPDFPPGGVLVSFLSSWIVPARVLEACTGPAVNFHPAPPEYPGIGCYNFALYHGSDNYGVTCHHMESTPDTGRLVDVVRFPLHTTDTVSLLKDRSMVHLLAQFYRIAPLLARGDALPETPERWTRRPFLRSELNALGRVTPDMEPEEIRRRVRAMSFPGAPGAFLDIAGVRFEASGEPR